MTRHNRAELKPIQVRCCCRNLGYSDRYAQYCRRHRRRHHHHHHQLQSIRHGVACKLFIHLGRSCRHSGYESIHFLPRFCSTCCYHIDYQVFLWDSWNIVITFSTTVWGLVHLFIHLSVTKMQKTRYSQKLSNLELQCPLTTYRKSYMGFSKNPLWDP